MTVEPDLALRNLVAVIVRGDGVGVAQLLKASPALARARFQVGASRQTEQAYFLAQVQRYVWEGDTALHIAAAGYQAEIAGKLIAAGADVGARNRLGDEPLHAASVGSPGSRLWNPSAQVATIVCLIDAGAAPNA